MMRPGTIGLVTFFEVAGFKHQIPVLNSGPNMFARIAIAPLEDQAILVFIEAALTVDVVPIEHLQNFAQFTVLDDLSYLGGHLRCSLRIEVFFRNV